MTAILFVSYNRLEYTRQSFTALLANTGWGAVDQLYVADDGSEDGTREWLREQLDASGLDWTFRTEPFGGPVAAMLWLLERIPAESAFAKIDNDVIVPPGWLAQAEAAAEWLAADCDVLGLGYREEPDPRLEAARRVEWARHIGGVGLIRKRVFNVCRPVANGRFGFTEWQEHREALGKGWLTPPLPLFELDRIPVGVGPWRALAKTYERKGWQRLWPEYPPEASAYWSWWQSV